MTPLGVEYGCKYTLTGPDGTIAVFNDSSDPDFVGILSPESSGLDSPEVREDAQDNTEDDGGIHGNFFYGRRPVILQGTIIASSATQRNERVDKLQRASNAMRGDATLKWKPQGASEEVQLSLRRQQPVRITKGYVKDFQVPMVSSGPYIAGATLKSTSKAKQEDLVTDVTTVTAVAVDENWIYRARGNDIYRSKLDGTSSAKFIESAATSGGISGLAVNATHIFWGDVGGGQIGRAKIDGTEKVQAFITTPTTIKGVAINASNIFWGDSSGEGSIGRATLAGGSPEAAWLTAPTTSINNIAVNATHIYWAGGGAGTKIGRATIAGAEATNEWANPAVTTRGISADANWVYFGGETAASNAIMRIKTSGTGIEYYVIYGELGIAARVQDIAMNANYIYWSNFGSEGGYSIRRIPISNKIEVTNSGNADALPTIKIYGPYDGTIELTNETDSGKKLVIPYELLPEATAGLNNGDSLEINFNLRTIKWTDISKGETTSVYSKLAFEESDWWALKPGVNMITTDTPLKIEISYRNAWI